MAEEGDSYTLTLGLEDLLSPALSTAADSLRVFTGSVETAIYGFGRLSIDIAPVVAIGLALRNAASDAAVLQQAVANLHAVLQATPQQYAGVQANALALSQQSQFTSGQVLKEDYNLAKGNVSAQDLQPNAAGNVTGNVLDLAGATQSDTALAATAYVTASRQFNTNVLQSKQTVDNLAQAVDSSTGNLSQMMQALKQVGTVAADAGYSQRDTITALAALSEAGFQGDAGTSLKTFIQRLQHPTAGAQAVEQQIGFNPYGANGQLLDLPTIFNKLQSSEAGLTDQQRSQDNYTLFGARGTRVADYAAQAGSSGLTDTSEHMASLGDASTINTEKIATFNGQVGKLSSSLNVLSVEGGQAILPMLMNMASAAEHAANGLSSMGAASSLIPSGVMGALAITGEALAAHAVGNFVQGKRDAAAEKAQQEAEKTQQEADRAQQKAQQEADAQASSQRSYAQWQRSTQASSGEAEFKQQSIYSDLNVANGDTLAKQYEAEAEAKEKSVAAKMAANAKYAASVDANVLEEIASIKAVDAAYAESFAKRTQMSAIAADEDAAIRKLQQKAADDAIDQNFLQGKRRQSAYDDLTNLQGLKPGTEAYQSQSDLIGLSLDHQDLLEKQAVDDAQYAEIQKIKSGSNAKYEALFVEEGTAKKAAIEAEATTERTALLAANKILIATYEETAANEVAAAKLAGEKGLAANADRAIAQEAGLTGASSPLYRGTPPPQTPVSSASTVVADEAAITAESAVAGNAVKQGMAKSLGGVLGSAGDLVLPVMIAVTVKEMAIDPALGALGDHFAQYGIPGGEGGNPAFDPSNLAAMTPAQRQQYIDAQKKLGSQSTGEYWANQNPLLQGALGAIPGNGYIENIFADRSRQEAQGNATSAGKYSATWDQQAADLGPKQQQAISELLQSYLGNVTSGKWSIDQADQVANSTIRSASGLAPDKQQAMVDAFVKQAGDAWQTFLDDQTAKDTLANNQANRRDMLTALGVPQTQINADSGTGGTSAAATKLDDLALKQYKEQLTLAKGEMADLDKYATELGGSVGHIDLSKGFEGLVNAVPAMQQAQATLAAMGGDSKLLDNLTATGLAIRGVQDGIDQANAAYQGFMAEISHSSGLQGAIEQRQADMKKVYDQSQTDILHGNGTDAEKAYVAQYGHLSDLNQQQLSGLNSNKARDYLNASPYQQDATAEDNAYRRAVGDPTKLSTQITADQQSVRDTIDNIRKQVAAATYEISVNPVVDVAALRAQLARAAGGDFSYVDAGTRALNEGAGTASNNIQGVLTQAEATQRTANAVDALGIASATATGLITTKIAELQASPTAMNPAPPQSPQSNAIPIVTGAVNLGTGIIGAIASFLSGNIPGLPGHWMGGDVSGDMAVVGDEIGGGINGTSEVVDFARKKVYSNAQARQMGLFGKSLPYYADGTDPASPAFNKYSFLSETDYDRFVTGGEMNGASSPMLTHENYQALLAAAQKYNLDPRWMLATTLTEGHMGTDPNLAAASVNNFGGEKWAGQGGGAYNSGITADNGGTYAGFPDLGTYFNAMGATWRNSNIGPATASGDPYKAANVYTDSNNPDAGKNKVTAYNNYVSMSGGNAASPDTTAATSAAGSKAHDIFSTARHYIGQNFDAYGSALDGECEKFVNDVVQEATGVPFRAANPADQYNQALAGAKGAGRVLGPGEKPQEGDIVILLPGVGGASDVGHAGIDDGNGNMIATGPGGISAQAIPNGAKYIRPEGVGPEGLQWIGGPGGGSNGNGTSGGYPITPNGSFAGSGNNYANYVEPMPQSATQLGGALALLQPESVGLVSDFLGKFTTAFEKEAVDALSKTDQQTPARLADAKAQGDKKAYDTALSLGVDLINPGTDHTDLLNKIRNSGPSGPILADEAQTRLDITSNTANQRTYQKAVTDLQNQHAADQRADTTYDANLAWNRETVGPDSTWGQQDAQTKLTRKRQADQWSEEDAKSGISDMLRYGTVNPGDQAGYDKYATMAMNSTHATLPKDFLTGKAFAGTDAMTDEYTNFQRGQQTATLNENDDYKKKSRKIEDDTRLSQFGSQTKATDLQWSLTQTQKDQQNSIWNRTSDEQLVSANVKNAGSNAAAGQLAGQLATMHDADILQKDKDKKAIDDIQLQIHNQQLLTAQTSYDDATKKITLDRSHADALQKITDLSTKTDWAYQDEQKQISRTQTAWDDFFQRYDKNVSRVNTQLDQQTQDHIQTVQRDQATTDHNMKVNREARDELNRVDTELNQQQVAYYQQEGQDLGKRLTALGQIETIWSTLDGHWGSVANDFMSIYNNVTGHQTSATPTPGHAAGGRLTNALELVGEEGPEIVAGGNVLPAGMTSSILGRLISPPAQQHINVQMGDTTLNLNGIGGGLSDADMQDIKNYVSAKIAANKKSASNLLAARGQRG